MIKIVDGIDENGKPKKFRLEIPMKYIRTTNGVYENILSDLFGEYKYFHGEEILKQADTIQELCDVIVCGTKIFYSLSTINGLSKFNWDEIKEYCNKSNIKTIKGAIWTDKGLIYVTKMKGILPSGEIDWELL